MGTPRSAPGRTALAEYFGPVSLAAIVVGLAVLSAAAGGVLAERVDWPWFNDQRAIETLVAVAQLVLAFAVFAQIRSALHDRARAEEDRRTERDREEARTIAEFTAACANAMAVYENHGAVRDAAGLSDPGLISVVIARGDAMGQTAHNLYFMIEAYSGQDSPLAITARNYRDAMNRKRRFLVEFEAYLRRGESVDGLLQSLNTRLGVDTAPLRDECIAAARRLLSTRP